MKTVSYNYQKANNFLYLCKKVRVTCFQVFVCEAFIFFRVFNYFSSRLSYNRANNILRLFDAWANFSFTISHKRNEAWLLVINSYIRVAWRVLIDFRLVNDCSFCFSSSGRFFYRSRPYCLFCFCFSSQRSQAFFWSLFLNIWQVNL